MNAEIKGMTKTELLDYIRQLEEEHKNTIWRLTREKAEILLARNRIETNWADHERDSFVQEIDKLRDEVEAKDRAIEEYGANCIDLEQKLSEKSRDLANALRILKERANVDRDVRPKSRTGYLLQSFEEWLEKVYSDDEAEVVLTYKTVLQTFCDYGFDLNVVRDLVRDALIAEILPAMQLPENVFVDHEYQEDAAVLKKRWDGEQNLIYRMQLKFNAGKGYYEVTIYHTLPIGMIPEDLLPTQKPNK